MHNGFLDRRRRFLNLREMQVENVLPEHFAQFYPKFIELLKSYYEWQDQNDPNELLNHLFAVRDINETDISLLSFIEDEFLLGEAYFEGFGTEEFEKRAAANFSNIQFRSKGTKFAIEWFFRSFYGLDAEVVYPKENVFTLGNTESQIGPDSLRYLTNDKLYQTFALLVRVGVPISKWRDIFKLFAHPAGMYLGAEVTVNDIITPAINAVMQDSAATQRASTVYTLTRSIDGGAFTTTGNNDPVDDADEGSVFKYKISSLNAPAGDDFVRWFVDFSGETSASDFGIVDSATAGPFAYPFNINTQANKSELGLYQDSALGPAYGFFTVPTSIDSVETEGQELFTVYVEDGLGRTVAADQVVLNDLITQYQMSLPATVDEGSTLQIDIAGTVVPNSKAFNSTTLYWYVEHLTTSDSDFATPPPDSASPLPVLIRNSTGTITIPIRPDNVTDAAEEFKVYLQTFDGIKKDSATVEIVNQAAVFTVVADQPSYTEGETLSCTITHSTQDAGDTVSWAFTGALASDPRPLATSGTLTLSQGTQTTFSIQCRSDATYRGPITGQWQITNNNYVPALIATSTSFTVNDLAPTYTISMNPISANEGDTVAFDISGTNIPNGTYYLSIGNVNTNDLDFDTYAGTPGAPGQGANPRAGISVTSNTGTSANLVFANNSETADESFYAYLYSAVSGGTLLASQLNQIRGGSAPTYTLTPSTTAIQEGNTITFTFTTTGPDGVFNYEIKSDDIFLSFDYYRGITRDDFGTTPTTMTNIQTPGLPSGSFTVSGGTGTFELFIRNDGRDEDATEQDFYAVVQNGSGVTLAQSASVRISDAVSQTYTLTSPDTSVVEDVDNLILSYTTTSTVEEDLYFELVDGSNAVWTGKFANPQVLLSADGGFTFGGGSGSGGGSTADMGKPILNNVYEGELFGTAKLSRDDYASNGGTVLATLAFSVLDKPATWTLSGTPTTVNEGGSIVWTVGGTNIQNGTYYYSINDYTEITTLSGNAGNSSIRSSHPNVSPALVGDICINNSAAVPGVVTGVFAVTDTSNQLLYYQITMSEPLNAGLSGGTRLVFGSSETLADFASGSAGTFTMTSNSGGFTTATAANQDTQDDTYTMRIFESIGVSASQTPAASVGFTITDTTAPTTSQVNFALNSPYAWNVFNFNTNSGTNEPVTSLATIVFDPSGAVFATGNASPGGTQEIGTWHQSASTIGNFTLRADIIAGPTSVGRAVGSYGTNLSLSSSKRFDLSLSSRAANDVSNMSVRFTVTDNSDPRNTKSQTIDFTSEVETSDIFIRDDRQIR